MSTEAATDKECRVNIEDPDDIYDSEGYIDMKKVVGGGYDDFWWTRKFYRVCKGAKGSKKSATTALWYIMHMMQYPEANVLVVRRYYGTLYQSCYTDLLWAIDRLHLQDEWTWTTSPLKITRKETGQVIIFRGLDDAMKLASIRVRHGYLCWVWVEEAFEITNEDNFKKLEMSIRGFLPPETGLFKQFTFTFNPWSEHTWLKERFFDNPAPNVFSKTTTYRDNEWIMAAPEDRERYERMYIENPRAARVYCDGDWGIAEGLVYSNWFEDEFDIYSIMNQYPNAKPTFGLDFGYAISYNGFIAVLVDIGTRQMWIFDEYYDKGRSNIELARKICQMGYGKEVIWADAAEPKSIFELQAGLLEKVVNEETGEEEVVTWALPNIRPALKGPDSVRFGIQNIQSFKVFVHPRCVNTIVELNNYCYDTDKDGNYIDKPIKDFDHLMDAWRYSVAKFFIRGKGHVFEAKGDSERAASPRTSKRVFST